MPSPYDFVKGALDHREDVKSRFVQLRQAQRGERTRRVTGGSVPEAVDAQPGRRGRHERPPQNPEQEAPESHE